MNFCKVLLVKYFMRKILRFIKPLICFLLCVAVCLTFSLIAFKNEETSNAQEGAVLKLWQIDNFEGGKGSRAEYLKQLGEKFSKESGCFISVTALSAEAASLSLADGNIPDLISYGAGICGIESYISSYTTWCHGGYCLLTLDESCDFSDINSENTIINEGKDNFAGAAALMIGLKGAKYEKSTSAYVRLINGDYKYMLGTQRDIFRLKTRGVSFAVKPISQYNDLYQNISLTQNCEHKRQANEFINFILSKSSDIVKLGMIANGTVYEDEMKVMTGLEYEYILTSPISLDTRKQFEKLISDGDINMLKNLLK